MRKIVVGAVSGTAPSGAGSYNCLDRQVEAGLGDKVAIISEADDGQVTRVTYSELLARTCRLANALKKRGVQRGIRCSCSTHPARPASPRACSTAAAATCCSPR